MGFADNYLKLRQQRQESAGGTTPSAPVKQKTTAAAQGSENSFASNYLQLRQQRTAPVVTLPSLANAVAQGARQAAASGTAPVIPLPSLADTAAANLRSTALSNIKNSTAQAAAPTSASAEITQTVPLPVRTLQAVRPDAVSSSLKSRVNALNEQIEQLKTADHTLSIEEVNERKDQLAQLKSERDQRAQQYYYAENQEKQAALQKDPAAQMQYATAKELQADMDKITAVIGALQDARADEQTKKDQAYLAKKYGLSNLAVNSPTYESRMDLGNISEKYGSLQALYDALTQQKRSAVETLAASGFDYGRMAEYEKTLQDAEEYAKKQAEWQQYAEEHPIISSANTVLFSPIQGVDYLTTMASGIGRSDTSKPESYVPMNVYNMDATNFVSTVRGTVSKEIEENTNWELFGQNVGSFLYQTGMSVADSAVQVATLGEWATLVMGMSAASNQAKDIIEQGGTNSQAFWGGLAAGAAEAVFEKVSIDKLLSAKSVTSVKSLLKETAQQAGVEASEETFTEIANILSDAAIMKDKSDYSVAVKQYMAQGMSEDEAKRQAFLDCIKQVALAGAGGALSGMAMGGAVSGFNYAASKSSEIEELPIISSLSLRDESTQSTAQTPTQTAAHQNVINQTQDTTGQKNTVPIVETVKADTRDVVTKLRENISTLQNADTVSHLNGNEFARSEKRLSEQVTDFFKSIGNKVFRRGLGDVTLDSQSVRSDIAHGVGRAKAITFAAVPEVIANGQQIDYQENWKGRGRNSYIFAAPVDVGGQKTYVAAVVLSDAKNRFYLHEVVDSDGNVIYIKNDAPGTIKTGVTAQSGVTSSPEASTPQTAASDGTSALAGDLDTVADTGTNQIIPQETQEVNGWETQQGVKPPIMERRAVEEPPMTTGGIYHGEQLQQSADRASDGGAAAADRIADSGEIEANLSDRGQGRLSDESAGGQDGVLADSPEGARRRAADQGRAAVERQNLAKTLRQQKVSSRSLGIERGTDTPNLTVATEESWDAGMQATAERVRNETGKQVTYVLGRIQLGGKDGELHYVRGVYTSKGIILQADNMRLSIDQIADHEIFHNKVRQSPGLVSQIKERIVEQYGREKLDKALDTYIRKLRGVIDVPENATQFEMDDALQDIMEEIFADAYAGINAFSAHAEQFNETVEQTMNERGVGRDTQTTAATERTTGPPVTRFSTDEDQDAEAEQKKKKRTTKPVAESKPVIAKNDLRKNMLSLFSIPEGQRAELGTVIDQYADRLLKNDELTEEDRSAFFDRMYSSGVMSVPADEYYQAGREAVKGGRVYVSEQVRREFGDDWNEFRKRAFGAGVYLTGDSNDAGVDSWNMELSEMLPGLFDAGELDSRSILERIVQVAEEGKDEKVSLAEYTAMLAEQEYISEDELLDNMERQMDWALRTFAEKANLEIKLRDRTGIKIAQEREYRKEMAQRQRENRELRDLQQRTLKQLQWLSKNRYRAPEELRSTWDEVLGDIDIYAVNAANEMNWSKRYQATWRDLAEIYKDSSENDPNFVRSAEIERIVARLDNEKIGDMDIGALQDLYKAAVGIRTEFYNRNNVINDEMNRIFAEVYTDAKQEIADAPSRYTGKIVDRFMNMEQLTPMNMLERMGGWNPNGAFYSMAKQLEHGERISRDYTVRAERTLENFLTEHEDWAKKADGQGKDAIWYELEVPELLELHMGDKPIFGKTVTVYMTPAQKVHLYLESKNEQNLRHMMGGRTFVNKELYSKGKRQEALAQGTTVKLAPETVKKIVSDLTEEEVALARALDSYYNNFASERINKVSNALYGFDKAVSQNYAPIYTNQNYTKSELGVFDVTAEGVGNLKGRIPYSQNPSYNISAFDAFARHMDQTARFVGMAIPARNWNTLLNWRESNNSMGQVITDHWGQEGKTYIEDLLVELQGGKTTEERSAVESLMDTALSNYISSVFGFNPSIVFKQAMSLPLAGTYLGWENMPNIPKALATDNTLINTYTSELAYRLMGYSTPETAQLKNNPSKLEQNKLLNFTFRGGAITAMDGWTVKTIWRWAENKVRRTSPDLEAGTQEQIDAGQSPFYQAVAKEFEEAVSRSQPMYDVMHRSQIMRSSNKAVRALTLFKTVPQQQYNMLRQTEGEAKYYKREYQNGNVTKEEYTQAKKKVGRAALGIIAAGLGIEAINFLNALLKNKAKRYRDDEGELTWTSGWRQFLEGFASDNLGMIIGGDLTVEILGSVILGDNWYGIETPGITQIEDVFEELISSCQTIQGLVQDGYKVLSEGGDPGEYFQRHGADYLGALDEALGTVLTYFGGVAANNIKGYTLGALSWMSPQLATTYEDWLATADKSGLAGLTGEALETRVGDILENRLGEADDETAAALASLYEAGYKTAIPTDTPSSVTVNSESVNLSAYQQQFYDTVWREAIGDSLDELISSKEFLNTDAETQAKMAAKLYSYAAEKAKSALFEDFSKSAWIGELDAAIKSGESAAEWIAWEVLTSDVSEKVLTALTDAGMSQEDALELATEYKTATAGLTADKDENGKTIPGSKRKKVLTAIDALNITSDQKTALYFAAGYSESTLTDAPWYSSSAENTPQELPSRDWSAVIGLPSLVD